MAEWALQNPWWIKKERQQSLLQAGAQSFDRAYAQSLQNKKSSNDAKKELLQLKSMELNLQQQEDAIKDAALFQDYLSAYEKDPYNTQRPKFNTAKGTEDAIAAENAILKRKAAQKAIEVDNEFFKTASSYKDPSFTAELLEMKTSGAPMSKILPRMRQFSEIERQRDIESKSAGTPPRFDITQSQRIMVEHDLTSLRERERALNDKAASIENMRILNPKEYENAKAELNRERRSLKEQEQSIRGQLQPKAEGGAEAPKQGGLLNAIGGAAKDVLGLFIGGQEEPVDTSPLPMPGKKTEQPEAEGMPEDIPLSEMGPQSAPLWQQPGYQPSSSAGIRG